MTRVPGRTKKLSAYISELWGLLSVITVIHNMWKYHAITIGSISLGCNMCTHQRLLNTGEKGKIGDNGTYIKGCTGASKDQFTAEYVLVPYQAYHRR